MWLYGTAHWCTGGLYLDTDSAWIQPRNKSLREIEHHLPKGTTFFAAREPSKPFLANGVFGSLVTYDPSLKYLIKRCRHLLERANGLILPSYSLSGPFLLDDLEYMIEERKNRGESFDETLGVMPTRLFYPFNWHHLRQNASLVCLVANKSFEHPALFPEESIMMQYGWSTSYFYNEKPSFVQSLCRHHRCWIAFVLGMAVLLPACRSRTVRRILARGMHFKRNAVAALLCLLLFSLSMFMFLVRNPIQHQDPFRNCAGMSYNRPQNEAESVYQHKPGQMMHSTEHEHNSQPVLSAHTCVGGSFLQDGWLHRTCHFSNLYLLDSDHWYYLVEDEESLEFLTAHANFSVALAPNSADPTFHNVRFAPTVIVIAKFVEMLGKRKANDIISTERPTFFFAEYNGENFGHVILDSLLPAFNGLTIFDLLGPDPLFLLNDVALPWNCFWQRANLGQAGADAWNRCSRFYSELYPLMTSIPLEILHTSGSGQSGYLRHFHNLVVGSGDLSDHCNDPTVHGVHVSVDTQHCNRLSAVLRVFVEHTMFNIGVNPRPDPRRQMSVIFLHRDDDSNAYHSRTIAHSTELVRALQRKIESVGFPWLAGLKTLRSSSFVKLPIRKQVQTFRDCVALIGPPGAASMVAIYMPMHSAFIQLSENARDYGMDWQILSALPNVETTYIRVEQDPNWSATWNAVRVALTRWDS
eukprot:SAG31_NODE_1724_length_7442_cov_3.433533_4_plen_696_part_00